MWQQAVTYPHCHGKKITIIKIVISSVCIFHSFVKNNIVVLYILFI